MIFLIVGHRGAGKSWALSALRQKLSFLKRDVQCIDLDLEIEDRYGSIDEIFKKDGETEFRKLESEVFDLISKSNHTPKIIAVGGGFDISRVQADEVIWLRRESDISGRIFLDRPRLDKNMSPLEEWQKRFEEREQRFRKIHTQVLTLPEGKWASEKVLIHFFAFWFSELKCKMDETPFDITLLPGDVERVNKKNIFKFARRVEIRDDLRETKNKIKEFEANRIYYSFRRLEDRSPQPMGYDSDWDLSLGEPPHLGFWSYSLHDSNAKIFKNFDLPEGSILKWSPEIKNFTELKLGHEWYLEDPRHRAFLPRSSTGRWRWYRRLFGPKMPIHFVRDDQGSAPDQPFWYETWLQPLTNQGFAAVLGDPVHLSWSPSFHHDFFKDFHMPFVAIDLPVHEFKTGLEILKELGLRAAAVTSPLKKEAFKTINSADPAPYEIEAVNTLYISNDKIIGTNTDLIALKNLAQRIDRKDPIIWGGGGLAPTLKAVFPGAKFFKARSGGNIPQESTLIWASIRSPDVKFPEPLSHLKDLVDLNYSESSMGRELALRAGCGYVSGELFFKEQAQAQQDFWRRFL